MIAFKNLLIFLIIFICETTGNNNQRIDQYLAEVRGTLTCILKETRQAFVSISTDPLISSVSHYIGRETVNYGQQFSITGKHNFTGKPNLYLQIRHSCFKKDLYESNCRTQIIGKQIPSSHVIVGHGQKENVWDIGELELSNPGDGFNKTCN
uniref:Uncharacterized protein n=1 Tax=Strongyloides papillosus TaxID=174720 RepID=A0A0N5BHZ4_STREA